MVKIFKYILATFFVALITTQSKAQYQKKNKLSIGFEAGYQSTSITNDISSTAVTGSGGGLNASVFGSYPVSNSLNFELGFRYDSRGFTTKDFINPIAELQSDDSIYVSWSSYYSDSFKYRLNYLTIPISVVYERGNDKHKIFLKLSFYYSLLLNAQKSGNTELFIDPEHAPNFEDPELQQAGYTYNDINKADITNKFNSDDYGIQFFIGYQYKINEKFALRFTPGLTIGLQTLSANPLDNSKWNNIYLINAGIIYTLK